MSCLPGEGRWLICIVDIVIKRQKQKKNYFIFSAFNFLDFWRRLGLRFRRSVIYTFDLNVGNVVRWNKSKEKRRKEFVFGIESNWDAPCTGLIIIHGVPKYG